MKKYDLELVYEKLEAAVTIVHRLHGSLRTAAASGATAEEALRHFATCVPDAEAILRGIMETTSASLSGTQCMPPDQAREDAAALAGSEVEGESGSEVEEESRSEDLDDIGSVALAPLEDGEDQSDGAHNGLPSDLHQHKAEADDDPRARRARDAPPRLGEERSSVTASHDTKRVSKRRRLSSER